MILERNATGLLDDYGNDLDADLFGVSEDGRYALVVVNGAAYIGTVQGSRISGLRWECSEAHLGYYPDVYRSRFPEVAENCECGHDQGAHAADMGPCVCACPSYMPVV